MENKKGERRYILEVSESQARTLCRALEFTGRMRIGQWKELIGLCLDVGDVDEFCRRRDELEVILENARQIAYPELSRFEHSYGIGKFRDANQCWDLYEVIRNCLAWTNHPEGGTTVDFGRPMNWSNDPNPPICRAKKD